MLFFTTRFIHSCLWLIKVQIFCLQYLLLVTNQHFHSYFRQFPYLFNACTLSLSAVTFQAVLPSRSIPSNIFLKSFEYFPDIKVQNNNSIIFLSEWLEFPSPPCLAKNNWWQLASRCCWNRARRLTYFLWAFGTKKCLQFGTWTDPSFQRHYQFHPTTYWNRMGCGGSIALKPARGSAL